MEPLDSDQDKNGKKADHRIVVAKPINVINNKTGRESRKVKVRPFTQSGFEKMKKWFIDQTWNDIFEPPPPSLGLASIAYQYLTVQTESDILG